jgi:D-alanyl-D-alanine carboxypeptidase
MPRRDGLRTMAVMTRALVVFLLLLSLAPAACGRDGGDRTVAIARLTPTPSPVRATASPTPAPPQLCLVTRERSVPASYVPPDLVVLPADQSVRPGVQLRREAAQALLQLLAAAREAGVPMLALSGYRSYSHQAQVLEDEIRAYGEAQARRQVAEPGHSEHQLGVAVDVTTARKPFDLDQTFGGEPEGIWLAANAARFGFVISYPLGKEAITGYVYEPWHIRYVGVPLAQQVLISGQTLTEFLSARGMADCPPGI